MAFIKGIVMKILKIHYEHYKWTGNGYSISILHTQAK